MHTSPPTYITIHNKKSKLHHPSSLLSSVNQNLISMKMEDSSPKPLLLTLFTLVLALPFNFLIPTLATKTTSQEQVACTMCTSCHNPCKPLPSPPPPSPPSPSPPPALPECPPPPPPALPECPPPPPPAEPERPPPPAPVAPSPPPAEPERPPPPAPVAPSPPPAEPERPPPPAPVSPSPTIEPFRQPPPPPKPTNSPPGRGGVVAGTCFPPCVEFSPPTIVPYFPYYNKNPPPFSSHSVGLRSVEPVIFSISLLLVLVGYL